MVKSGDFYYTAGNYTVTKREMQNALKALISDYNAACGDVNLIADDLQYGKLEIEYKCYNITFWLELHKNLLPFLSRTYEIGENLSDEDVMALCDAAIEGKINSPLLKALKDK